MRHVVFRTGMPGFFCTHCESAARLKDDSVQVDTVEFSKQSREFQVEHAACEAPTKRELAMRAELFGHRIRAPFLEASSKRYHEALMAIVRVGFDNPASALMHSLAKEAIAEGWHGPCVHGRDPYDRCDECGELTRAEAWGRAQAKVQP